MRKFIAIGLVLLAASVSAQTTVNFYLTNMVSTGVSNRTVTLKPLALWPHPSSVPSYDRINTNSGSGAFSISNMMDGTYQVDVLSPPDNTRFFIVLSNAGPAVSADTIMYASPTSTYPPGNYSWSITASDARYARWTATNSQALSVLSNLFLVNANGTNYLGGLTDTNLVNQLISLSQSTTNFTNLVASIVTNSILSPNNVKYWGAKGDNSTDDGTSINLALLMLGSTNYLYWPKGVYLSSTPILFTNRQFRTYGDGKKMSVLKYTGSAVDSFVTVKSDIYPSYNFDFWMSDLEISGSINCTNTLKIQSIAGSSFDRISLRNARNTVLLIDGGVLDSFNDVTVSVQGSEPGWINPTNCVRITSLAGSNLSNSLLFNNLNVDSAQYDGVLIEKGSSQLVFNGGTSENNGRYGFWLTSTNSTGSAGCTWTGVDCESNGSWDYNIEQFCAENILIGSLGATGVRIDGFNNTFQSCRFNTILMDTNSLKNAFIRSGWNIFNTGTKTDLGSQNDLLGLANAAAATVESRISSLRIDSPLTIDYFGDPSYRFWIQPRVMFAGAVGWEVVMTNSVGLHNTNMMFSPFGKTLVGGGTVYDTNATLSVNGSLNVGGTIDPGAGIIKAQNGILSPSLTITNAGAGSDAINFVGSGNIGFLNTPNTFFIQSYAAESSARIRIQGFSGASLANGSGDQLVVTENGRIGLGTNNPQTKIHVNGRATFDGNVILNGLSANQLVGTASDNSLQSVLIGPGLVLNGSATLLSSTVSNVLSTAFTTNSGSTVTGIVAAIVSSFPYTTNAFTTNPPATTTNIVIGLAQGVLSGLPYLTNAFTTNTSAGATGVVNSIIAAYPFTFTTSNYVDTVSNSLFNSIIIGDNQTALAAAIGTLNATNGLNISLSNWIRLLATNTYAGIINALGFIPATNGVGSGWIVGGNTIGSGSSTFGTLDDFPINFTANNQAIGKIEANTQGANIILGTLNSLAANKSVSSNNLVIGGYGNSLIGASYNTIVGGRNHTLSGTNYNAIIGGYGGLIAVDSNSIVAGGYANHISTIAGGGNSIFGGSANTISNAGFFSSILGGRFNKIGDNAGVAYSSAILGGENNTLGAEGSYSTILGGDANYIQSSYNIVGGHGVSSSNLNCFVWGDDQGAFYSTNANSFNVQARGGVRFSTGSEAVKMNNATVYANLNAPANIANFGFTANPITLGSAYTNTARRATLILNIAANYVTNGVPSCTVSIEQLGRGGATTNIFTHSPLPLYFPMASCAITNIVNVGHVNPSGVVTVTDTSTGGASVSIVKSVIELE